MYTRGLLVILLVAVGANTPVALERTGPSNSLRPFAARSPGEQVTAQWAIGGRFALVDTLRAAVIGSVGFDPSTKLYRYSYTVLNESNSRGLIERLELWPIDPRPEAVSSPEHWEMWPARLSASRALTWVTVDLGPPPPGWQDDSVSVYASAYCVGPGDTLSGFGFTSPLPPGLVNFKLDIFEEMRPAEEEGIPECPFRGATGTIGGPARPGSQ